MKLEWEDGSWTPDRSGHYWLYMDRESNQQQIVLTRFNEDTKLFEDFFGANYRKEFILAWAPVIVPPVPERIWTSPEF